MMFTIDTLMVFRQLFLKVHLMYSHPGDPEVFRKP